MCACTCSFYPFSLLIYSNNKTDAPKFLIIKKKHFEVKLILNNKKDKFKLIHQNLT